MKKLAIILSILFMSSMLIAQTDVNFDAQVRVRAELDNKDFNNDNDPSGFTLLRTRIGASFANKSGIEAYIQLQDSRYYGQEMGTMNDLKNVDLHQAYFKINDLFGLPLDVKGGRMEVIYGTQRLVGAVGWHNVGRSFDGGIVTLKMKNSTIDFFSFQERENFNPGDTADYAFTGLHAKWMVSKNITLQPFFYFQNTVPSENLSRGTLGALINANIEGLAIEAEGAYQFGKITPVATELDIAALMLTANVGYKFNSDYNPYLKAGFEMLSGDKDAADSEYGAFNTLYATNHKFYGFMDYFINIPASTFGLGLTDIHVKAGMAPHKKVGLNAAFHLFSSVEDYTLLNGDTSTSFGTEIDLTAKYAYKDNISFTTGFSFFSAGDIFKETRGEDVSYWSYFMTTVTF
ncbi:MAG: hypothetical protein SCALA702_14830 [Melioribacteraceae bacterium]|nr:MAG: hypothetical protein SCALA702_14830 [Melioribacteraceae bacterium]